MRENPKACMHNQNYFAKRYFDKDGTLMVHIKCLDCGWVDDGCVIGENNEGWEKKITVVDGNVSESS